MQLAADGGQYDLVRHTRKRLQQLEESK